MFPVCVYGSGNGGEFTGETNSLYLQAPQLLASPQALISTQTSSPPSGQPEQLCANANNYNEPHLKTFGNLFYDFQAAGDFDLATSGPHFIVESRQVPLPNPNQNLAVNQAIAARLGSSDVAVCTAPTRLLINKRPVHLASGGHISLPGGGEVWLTGTTYLMQDTAGDTVQATVNTGHPSWASQAINWVNATMYLPHQPATLHGLLASAPHNANAIQARNGTVLTPPFNFHQFYDLYGNSWRVSPSQSLLSACGKPPASTNPSNVYYSGNLPPKLAATARAECLAAGVQPTPPLLDACTLDAAILGENAAQDYLNMPTNLTWGKINPP
jgi:hypothetical protein